MTASFLALIQFVTFDERFRLSLLILSKTFVITGPETPQEGGGGLLPYMSDVGMCHCEGYGFQAVYSKIVYRVFVSRIGYNFSWN